MTDLHCLKVQHLWAICFFLGQVEIGSLLVRQCKYHVNCFPCSEVLQLNNLLSLSVHMGEVRFSHPTCSRMALCQQSTSSWPYYGPWVLPQAFNIHGLFPSWVFLEIQLPSDLAWLAFCQSYTWGFHKLRNITRNLTLPLYFLSLSNRSQLCPSYRLSISHLL